MGEPARHGAEVRNLPTQRGIDGAAEMVRCSSIPRWRWSSGDLGRHRSAPTAVWESEGHKRWVSFEGSRLQDSSH
jgi:hypothetical protein